MWIFNSKNYSKVLLILLRWERMWLIFIVANVENMKLKKFNYINYVDLQGKVKSKKK